MESPLFLNVIRAFSLSLLVVFQSCGVSSENSTNDSVTTSFASDPVIPDFTKSMEGTIGAKYGIIMTLTKRGTDLTGTYSYKSQGVSIKLSGSIDDSGNINLNGFDEKGNTCDVFTGQLVQGSITGNWSKPDGSKALPFSVSESSNTEADLQKDKNASVTINYSMTGTFVNGSNSITITELGSGDIAFAIQGKVDQNCAQNELSGTATHRVVTAMEGVRNAADWYEFSIDDCGIDISMNEDGTIAVAEDNCNGQRCARGASWNGKYTRK